MNGNFGGGNGSMFSPFLVEDAYDLDAVRNNLNAYYYQTNDIDLSVFDNWLPIGMIEGTTQINQFKGFYNGGKKTIYNLKINRPNTNYIGLFSNIWNTVPPRTVSIRNVVIENANIVGGENTGAICGYAYAEIKRCYVRNSYIENTDSRGRTGGIAGIYQYSKLSFCGVDNIHLKSVGVFNGGLVGDATQAYEIKYCYADNINMEVSSSTVGGLVGNYEPHGNYDSMIRYCRTSGVVSGTDEIGGLIGRLVSYGGYKTTIEWSYSNCEVNGAESVGGFIGYLWYPFPKIECAYITDCYATGKVIGTRYTAGFIGKSTAKENIVQRCYASGDVIVIPYETPEFDNVYEAGIVAGDKITAFNNFALMDSIRNSGTVYGQKQIGYISGFSPSDDMVTTNNFYLSTMSVSNLTNADGQPISKTLAMQKATYEDVNWEFGKRKWQIVEGQTYPFLDVSFTWVGVTEILVKQGGQWLEIEEIYEKKDGQWLDITEAHIINKPQQIN